MSDASTSDFHEELRAVAGEYVLDTLSVREKAAFEALLMKDPSLISLVDEWNRILTPVLESAPEEQPDQAVWQRVNKTIDEITGKREESADANVVNLDGIRRSRNRWRNLSAGIMSLAAGVAAFVVIDGSLLQPPSVVPDRMTVLTSETAGIQFVATVDPSRLGIHIRPLVNNSEADPFANGPLELWVQRGEAIDFLGQVTSASWQWLNYAEILQTEEFDKAELLLTRSKDAGVTPPEEPGEIVFQGQISSRAK